MIYADSDVTRMYWPEVGLLPNDTMTAQEKAEMNECMSGKGWIARRSNWCWMKYSPLYSKEDRDEEGEEASC